VVAQAARPARRVPVARLQAAAPGPADLSPEEVELGGRQPAAPDEADGPGEARAGVVAVRRVVGGGRGEGGEGGGVGGGAAAGASKKMSRWVVEAVIKSKGALPVPTMVTARGWKVSPSQ
jgi:hypothetical protein